MVIEIIASNQMQMIATMIGVDVILGIIAALIKKEFILGKVAGFMKRGIVMYVFGFAVLSTIGEVIPSLSIMVTVGYWLIILSLIGSILDNLGKLGIPVPKMLRK